MVTRQSLGLPRRAAASILGGNRWWLGNIAFLHVPVLMQASPASIPRRSSNLSEIWRSPWARNCLARHFAVSPPKRDLKSNAFKREEEEEDDDENDEIEGDEDEDELEDEGEEDLESGSEEEEVVVIAKKEKKPKLQKREPSEVEGRVLNQDIKAKTVRLVLEGKEHKVVSREEALAYARKKNMDLVQVDGRANPPVCKVFDFHKEEYKQDQIQKDRKKKRVEMVRLEEVKELRFTSKTELKDLTMKVKKAKEFLEYGHRVKIVAVSKGEILTKIAEIQQDQLFDEDIPTAKVSFSERRRKAELEKKEREAAFLRKKRRETDISNMLDQVIPLMEDTAYIEQGPRIEGSQGWVLFRHVKFGKLKKKAPNPKPEPQAESADLGEEASQKLQEKNNAYNEMSDDVPMSPQMEKPLNRVPSPLSRISEEKPAPIPISYWLGKVQDAKASGKGPQTFGGMSANSMVKSQSPQTFGGLPGASTQVPQAFKGMSATLTPKSQGPQQALQGSLESAPLQSPLEGPALRSPQILPKKGPPAQQMQPPSNVRGVFPQIQPGSLRYPGSMSKGSQGMEKAPLGQVPSQAQENPPVNREGYSMPAAQGPGAFQDPQTYCPPPPRGRGFSPPTQQGYRSPPNPSPFPGGVLNQARPPPGHVSPSAPINPPPGSPSPEELPIFDFFQSRSQVQPHSPGSSRNTSAFQGALPAHPRGPQSSQDETSSPLGYPPQEGLPQRPVPSPLGYPPEQGLPPRPVPSPLGYPPEQGLPPRSVPSPLGYPPRPHPVPPPVGCPPQSDVGSGHVPSPLQSVPSPLGYPPRPHTVRSPIGYPPQSAVAPRFAPSPLGYPPKPGMPTSPAPSAGNPHYRPQQDFLQRSSIQQSPTPGDVAPPHDQTPPKYWPLQASTTPESPNQQQQIHGYSPFSDNTPKHS